jgi:hypothetical protein
MSSFEELRGRRSRHGCAVCGAATKGAVQINLYAGDHPRKHVVGQTAQFCEEHATALYLRLADIFNEGAGRA